MSGFGWRQESGKLSDLRAGQECRGRTSEVNVYFSDGLKMNKLFCLLSVLLPGACYRREIKVQAVRDIPVCRDSNAAYSRADFIVPKNSICYLGRKAYGKAGRFAAIRRTDGLEGWMIEDSLFRSVK